MAASTTQSAPTFSPIAKYALLIVAAIAAVVATYWLHLAPDAIGFAGAGTSILGLFTFATADLEQSGDPPGLPKGTTFFVVTGLAAVYGAAGVFTGQTLATYAAFLTWLLVVLEYVLTTFRSHLDAYVPSAYDSAIVAGVGIVIAVVQYLAANPTASLQSVVITAVVAVASYINLGGSAPSPSGSTVPASGTASALTTP